MIDRLILWAVERLCDAAVWCYRRIPRKETMPMIVAPGLAHVVDHPHLHAWQVAVLLALAAVMLAGAIRRALR